MTRARVRVTRSRAGARSAARARARARVVVPYTLEMQKSPCWLGELKFYISAQKMKFEFNIAFFRARHMI